MIQTELNKKGKSFRWVGEWKENEHYFNTEFAQDFCRIEGAVVVCKASHFSTQENKPKIVFDEQGNEIGIEKNAYWEIAILPNTDFIISGDNIPDGTPFEIMLACENIKRTVNIDVYIERDRQLIIIFFPFFIVDLQCCATFCGTAKCPSHICIFLLLYYFLSRD